ncbi:hypothetical protein ACROYT_G012514 [Oculina patagonica]
MSFVTTIVLILFGLYIANSIYVIYHLFHVPECKGSPRKCLQPHGIIDKKLEISIYTSLQQQKINSRNCHLLWKSDNFSLSQPFTKSVNASLPSQTRDNGSLYAHIFIYPAGSHPFENQYVSRAVAPLTVYSLPQDESINLLSEQKSKEKTSATSNEIPVTHWKPILNFHVLNEKVDFERQAIPGEIYPFIRLAPNDQYLPVLYIDQLGVIYRYLKRVNKSSSAMELKINYSPISLGKLRIWSSVHHSLKSMKDLGFSDKDLDEMRGIFTDTNLFLLAVTFGITVLHLLFDFLAFKNDINYWKSRNSMVGLSIRTVIWRCVSTLIIFLYLMDEKTSLLVLIPAGIGSLIEMWKVTKAFKVSIKWEKGARPTIQFGEKTSQEKETEQFDSEAMRYLSYALYPLLLAGAAYSLVYHPHKSWYSWIVRSLVNGVYVFGFLFMLPQLFVNYKLKSVAHLPWRAFMYKAFNTFIDDVFAFIIVMPTAHRLACFRDDVVFVIYLYQRWLYPVDMKRVNEFGVSYEDQEKEEKPHKD